MNKATDRTAASAEETVRPSPVSAVVDVVVREAWGCHATYSVDGRSGDLRWEGVRCGSEAPWHLARVPGTGGIDDDALVFLVTEFPTFEGCLVAARILGAIQDGDHLVAAVGVPVPDDSWSDTFEVVDLDVSLRKSLLNTIRDKRAGSSQLSWVDAGETARWLQGRRQAAALMRARKERHRSGAAWLDTSSPSRGEQHGGRHTWAEQLLPRLPLRFQKYVAGLLLDDERILFFLERPSFPIESSGPLGALFRRRIKDGLLVITDRSVLMMEDASPPDSTMVHWGYQAQTAAVERICQAEVLGGRSEATLFLTLWSGGERAQLSWPFPPDAASDLTVAARLLQGFAPSLGCRALRRTYQERERQGAVARLISEEGVTAGGAADLARAQLLPSDEPPAEVRATGRAGSLTVTDDAITWEINGRAGWTQVESVAWLELQCALTICRLRIELAGGEPLVIKFDYPEAPPFVQAFTRLRHQMGRP